MKRLMSTVVAVMAFGLFAFADETMEEWFAEDATTVAEALTAEGKTTDGTWSNYGDDQLTVAEGRIVLDADDATPIAYSPDAPLLGLMASVMLTDVSFDAARGELPELPDGAQAAVAITTNESGTCVFAVANDGAWEVTDKEADPAVNYAVEVDFTYDGISDGIVAYSVSNETGWVSLKSDAVNPVKEKVSTAEFVGSGSFSTFVGAYPSATIDFGDPLPEGVASVTVNGEALVDGKATVPEGAAAVIVITSKEGWTVDPTVIELDSVKEDIVDAATGSDTNEGTSAECPLRTLQTAVERCTAGDKVIVAPGVYEGIAPKADGFLIESTHGPDVTVIDGGLTNRCFNSPAYDVLLRGFTLRRGIGTGNPDYGGGAYGGMLDHCVISNCFASCGGGAAFSVMSNCLVTACREGGGGGGLGGGARDCYLYNCTIAGNSASGYGGGAFLDEEYVAHNTIVATNVCDRGYANGHDIYGNGYWVKVCTISDQDAKFVDADGGDYHLTARSDLCIDRGGNAFVSAERDLDGNNRVAGSRVDLGCFEYVHESKGWPTPSVEPDASAEEEAAAVAGAMEDAGFHGERATLLKTAAEYGAFTSWAEDRGYEPADMVKSSTAFVSVAIDADALLDSESEDIRIGDFTLSADGNWQIVLDLQGYGKPKVYASILKVAVGAKGSKDVAGDYEPLPSTVSAGSDGVVIKGKMPEKKEPCYFLKGTVR